MGMALIGLGGEWIEVNEAVLNMLQYSEEELLKLTFQDITHPKDLSLDLEHLTALTAGKIRSYQMEKRYFRKDGSVIWINLSVSMVTDINGNPAHYVSQIENITERKELHSITSRRSTTAMVIGEETKYSKYLSLWYKRLCVQAIWLGASAVRSLHLSCLTLRSKAPRWWRNDYGSSPKAKLLRLPGLTYGSRRASVLHSTVPTEIPMNP
ncbi:PAS domain S-box-containing protein [Marinobacter sp. LV10R510-11A]|nr:PAS domain S-box-containing protein [Marinobacter sp. LV10R510-11A]